MGDSVFLDQWHVPVCIRISGNIVAMHGKAVNLQGFKTISDVPTFKRLLDDIGMTEAHGHMSQ